MIDFEDVKNKSSSEIFDTLLNAHKDDLEVVSDIKWHIESYKDLPEKRKQQKALQYLVDLNTWV